MGPAWASWGLIPARTVTRVNGPIVGIFIQHPLCVSYSRGQWPHCIATMRDRSDRYVARLREDAGWALEALRNERKEMRREGCGNYRKPAPERNRLRGRKREQLTHCGTASANAAGIRFLTMVTMMWHGRLSRVGCRRTRTAIHVVCRHFTTIRHRAGTRRHRCHGLNRQQHQQRTSNKSANIGAHKLSYQDNEGFASFSGSSVRCGLALSALIFCSRSPSPRTHRGIARERIPARHPAGYLQTYRSPHAPALPPGWRTRWS